MSTARDIVDGSPDLADLVELLEQFPTLPTSLQDQAAAAASEIGSILTAAERTFPEPPHKGGISSSEGKALITVLSVTAMAQRHATEGCEHIGRNLMTAPRPVLVYLGRRLIVCRPCAVRVLTAQGEYPDDGRCDFCNQPTGLFTPAMWQAGPAAFIGDFCDVCVAAIVEVVTR